MRRFDKKKHIGKVNLLIEDRYLREDDLESMIDVSCAALSSIVIDGNYLLFKEKQKFQPIGGALKFEDSALPFLKQLPTQIDRTDNDIRVKIPSSKWDEFKEWFLSGRDREVSIDREINEEIGPFLDAQYIAKMNTSNYRIKEVITNKNRLFQIHQVTFPDDVREAILNLVKTNEHFMLATPVQIRTRTNGISDHSMYIL